MNTQNTHHARQSAFSLIEILVVSAIIVFLVSLVVVTVPQIRGSSLLVADTNNMRQIVQAGNHYRSNNSGLWPPIQFSSGRSDFTLFSLYVDNYNVFKNPAVPGPKITTIEQVREIEDYIYLTDLNGQFSKQDFQRGNGNTAPFDPADPTVNRILTYLFNLNQIDQGIIVNSSEDHHNGILNVSWLRDSRVEQKQSSEFPIPNMDIFKRMYANGANYTEILNDLNIPPGTELKCLHCGGKGVIMDVNSGNLVSDPACGGTGIITY